MITQLTPKVNLAPNTDATSQPVLKTFWQKSIQFNWKFGVFLVVLICIPRFLLVLQANKTGSYGAIGLIMVISGLAPFIFLNKDGRRIAGIKAPSRYAWLIPALIAGIAFSLLLHFIGVTLFAHTDENWYQYIGRSYKIPTTISPDDKLIMFIIVAITGMIFSPVGEELFFRGIVHSAFATSIGQQRASLIDALAFALTHLSHFGLVFIAGGWQFFALPAAIWVTGMFLVSLVFFYFKKKSGSITGAVICHAGFNLGMTYSIFYLL